MKNTNTVETITKSEAKKAVRYFEKKHPGSSVIASGWATHPQTEDDKTTGFQTVSVELWSEEERESYTVYLAVCLWDRRKTFVMKDAENWYTEPPKEEITTDNTENEEGESQKGKNTMKQYYITSNVNDRNATAKSLANGEKFDIWFTPGTVRHYDEQGDLICTESGEMDWNEVERIDPTESKTVYVGFNFGSYVYLTVTMHEGLTLDECVCLRGQGDIDTYKTESGEWVKCKADYDETLEKLRDLRTREDAEDKVANVAHKVEQAKTRSAWDRGVKAYAEELVEELREAVEGGYVDADELSNRRLFERAMLNGAADWKQYSEGGCSLCYDGQIAERLCAPRELRKTENGRRDPNPRETWIDVQSRALFQAAQLVLRVAF